MRNIMCKYYYTCLTDSTFEKEMGKGGEKREMEWSHNHLREDNRGYPKSVRCSSWQVKPVYNRWKKASICYMKHIEKGRCWIWWMWLKSDQRKTHQNVTNYKSIYNNKEDKTIDSKKWHRKPRVL